MKKIFSLIILLMISKISLAQIIITDVGAVELYKNEAYICWKTNVDATSIVQIGQGSLSTKVVYQDNVYTKEHKIKISNLTKNSVIYYQVGSKDKNGNILTTNSTSFLFKNYSSTGLDSIPPNKISNFQVVSYNYNTITLTWDKATDNYKKISGYLISGFDNGKGRTTLVSTVGINSTKCTIGITQGLRPNTFYNDFFGKNSSFYVQAIDSAGNISKPSDRISIFIPDSTTLIQQLSDSTKWSYSVNPTKNPIGGGNGYTKYVDISKANYVVYNKENFLYALSQAKSGEIVYVADSSIIDLTGTKNIKINKGVTLASGRGNNGSLGAILISKNLYPENNYDALFITNGDSVRITGLRIIGPTPEVWDHDMTRGVANAIRCFHQNLEVDNNELSSWNKWAIWLYITNKAYIHHNYIHHAILNGYGYGVWCGGAGSEINASALIEANIFEALRHSIASSGHPNSWEGRYNIISQRQFYTNIDRHDQGSKKIGGKVTALKNNLFFNNNYHYGIASPVDSVNGATIITGNYFRNDSLNSGVYNMNIYSKQTNDKIVNISNNHYSYEGMKLPTAIIYSSIDSGDAPLNVNFNGIGSFDNNGVAISRYVWRFGDGDYKGNEIISSNCSYTFKEPGVYNVSLTVYNIFGVPSLPLQKTITVTSPTSKYILSAWMKDSYPGDSTGLYEKQILVDDSVVWREDVSGEEGWQHIVCDLKNKGTSNSIHRIAARVVCTKTLTNYTNQICELYVWIDDFTVLNSNASVISFENPKLYPPWNQKFNLLPNGPGISTAIVSEDSRSGDQSARIRFVYGSNTPVGNWAEFYQYVTFK